MTTVPRGAALAPLSNRQKQVLGFLAKLAYLESESQVSFDEWRHSEVQREVGRPRLRECLNEHYLPLSAHFHRLIGNTDLAFKAAFGHLQEPRNWALFQLYKEVTAGKDVMPHGLDYARGFLRNKRNVALEDADDKAIWHAIFTVRRKIQSLRKVKRGGATAGDVLGNILSRPRYTKGPF